MPTTLLMKRAIADKLIAVMKAEPNLNGVKLFVRGPAPTSPSLEMYPFAEVIVASEEDESEMTGRTFDNVYTGLITFSAQLASAGLGDWIQPVADRVLTIPSYDQIEELIEAAKLKLRQPAYADLEALTVTDGAASEVVKAFALGGPREFGLDKDERTNTFENFGVIPFSVETLITY
jgi:hypothetical protein